MTERPHPIAHLKARHFKVNTELGQFFLASVDAARQIVSMAKLDEKDQVIEVGAGLGTLSLAVAERGNKVWSIEKDIRLFDILCQTIRQFPNNARVTFSDVRQIDLEAELAGDWILLAVLPLVEDLAMEILQYVFGRTRAISKGILVVPPYFTDSLSTLVLPSNGLHTSHGSLRVTPIGKLSSNDFWPKLDWNPQVVSVVRC